MHELLSFDKMITPKIITIVYWLGLVFALITGLSIIFAGPSGAAANLFIGILSAAAIAIGARIYCELLIVLFKMNEALQEIRQK